MVRRAAVAGSEARDAVARLREQVWLMPPSLDEVLADAIRRGWWQRSWTSDGGGMGRAGSRQALGAPALSPARVAGYLALRVHDRSALRAATGDGRPRAAGAAVAERLPAAGPQTRSGASTRHIAPAARTAAPHGPDRGAAGPGRLGAAGGRRDQGGGLSVVVADLDAQQLERLLERTERAIADLVPADLAEAQRLRAEVGRPPGA